MASIEHKGKSYEVDEDGFLLKGAEEWDENWVDYVKSVEGIVDITDEHQKVIDALQEYYKKNGIAPMVRMGRIRNSPKPSNWRTLTLSLANGWRVSVVLTLLSPQPWAK